MAAVIETRLQNKLAKILEKARPTPLGCLEYDSGKTKGGYSRYHMRYPLHLSGRVTVEAQMTASRAVYILHHRRPDLIGIPGTDQVSHLCHNPRCVRITHLHLESQEANNRRKPCHFNGACQGVCVPECIFPKSFPPCAGSGDHTLLKTPSQYVPKFL